MTSHYKRKYTKRHSACQVNPKGKWMAALYTLFLPLLLLTCVSILLGIRRGQVGNKRIGVLAGGDSPERAVSLLSGEHVTSALREIGYDAILLAIETADDIVPALAGIDTVFNVLHGGAGEDGTIALLLDVLGVSYPGSRPQACARAMDKPLAKEILSRSGISVPPGNVYSDKQDIAVFCEDALAQYGLPLVIKPCNQGSSIGVHIVTDAETLIEKARETRAQFGTFLIEKYIPGRELTAGILRTENGEEVLPIVEIVPKKGFFNYSAKYDEGMTSFIVPAKLDEKTTGEVKRISLASHRALRCSGYSRVDIRLTPDGTPYVLEVNTNPGMTPMSDLPRAAAAAGIDFSSLVQMMLKTAEQGGGYEDNLDRTLLLLH